MIYKESYEEFLVSGFWFQLSGFRNRYPFVTICGSFAKICGYSTYTNNSLSQEVSSAKFNPEPFLSETLQNRINCIGQSHTDSSAAKPCLQPASFQT
jgi:hypothetical protein